MRAKVDGLHCDPTKVAMVSSYTTTQFCPLLQLAAARVGIHIDLYEPVRTIPAGHHRSWGAACTRSPPISSSSRFTKEIFRLPEYSSTPEEDIQT